MNINVYITIQQLNKFVKNQDMFVIRSAGSKYTVKALENCVWLCPLSGATQELRKNGQLTLTLV